MATITSPSRLDSTKYLKKELKSVLKDPIDLIDFGSGGLCFLDVLRDLHYRGKYFGIDINPTYPLKVNNLSVDIKKQDILKLRLVKKYKQASCMWVLEHVKEDDRALKIISKSIQKGGYLVLAIPSIWTWPVEFGRHGFHYYEYHAVESRLKELGFKIEKSYSSSGFSGLIFMIITNWPRFFALTVAFLLYKLPFITKKNWKTFSKDFINSTVCSYTKTNLGVKLHNLFSLLTVKIDSQFKLFPQSYIFICKKASKKI